MSVETTRLLDPSRNENPNAGFFSENYSDARKAFVSAAKSNRDVKVVESIPISAIGYNREKLSIDVAWVGSDKPRKVIIHFSGTNGVEGYVGSAIQRNLLEESMDLDSDTAIIFIHALNPYGMATNRRVNENNVDLNRNLILSDEDRITDPLYTKLYGFINPPRHSIDFFKLRLAGHAAWYGISKLKEVLVSGQYDHPDGLSYGGKEIEEGPEKVFEWLEGELGKRCLQNASFMIIDVHTGLDADGKETLISPSAPALEVRRVFGDRVNGPSGYSPAGTVITYVPNLIEKVTHCARHRIFSLAVGYGTVSGLKVLTAMRNEASATRERENRGASLSPEAPERKTYRDCFFLQDRKWRHEVVEQGRDLVFKCLEVLKA